MSRSIPRRWPAGRQFRVSRPAAIPITRGAVFFRSSKRSISRRSLSARLMMSVRPYRDIHRRACRQIHVGKVPVGGDAPITVQSMTNTVTSDVKATVEQVQALERAGADIVRVSCPDQESALALKHIVQQVDVPIVADIHFHYKRAIEAAESGAACLRINPGNIGSSERVREVIKAAKDHGCSMRIGVNAGSLERDLLEKYGEPCPEAMVESALDHAKILEDNDFFEFKISCKASDVFLAVAAYQQLAEACDYPLHLGITEAGGLRSGTVKSSIGLGMLLWAGIGDTIRVSLSADPVEEIKVGYDMLKSLGLRRRGVTVISCPSCARQQFQVIKTVEVLEERLAHITTPLTLSVIGCVVNGPGEARETDIGFTGGGNNTHQVYLSGVTVHRLEHRRVFALGIDVGRRRDTDRTDAGRTEIGQDVAEQIRTDEDIEPIRMAHEMRGQDVDVVLVGLDLGIVLADRGEALVPERHCMDDAVRLGRRGDVLFARLRQLEGVAHDPVAAAAGEHRLLHRHFVLAAGEEAAADLGILALVVLAHDVEIDVARRAVLQRRLDPGHQP